MNQYLVSYNPPGTNETFYTVATWDVLESMLRKNEEAHGRFRVWLLCGMENSPKSVRIVHRVNLYWLEDIFGNIIEQ